MPFNRLIMDKKNIVYANNIIVFCILIGPFGFSIASYLLGNSSMGNISMGIFVTLLLIYFLFIKGYLNRENKSRSVSIFILHTLVIIQFLAGPFVWAGLNFWTGNFLTASITTAIFLVFLAIYMLYGKKYFQAVN